jgi:hypothetical protein
VLDADCRISGDFLSFGTHPVDSPFSEFDSDFPMHRPHEWGSDEAFGLGSFAKKIVD